MIHRERGRERERERERERKREREEHWHLHVVHSPFVTAVFQQQFQVYNPVRGKKRNVIPPPFFVRGLSPTIDVWHMLIILCPC